MNSPRYGRAGQRVNQVVGPGTGGRPGRHDLARQAGCDEQLASERETRLVATALDLLRLAEGLAAVEAPVRNFRMNVVIAGGDCRV